MRRWSWLISAFAWDGLLPVIIGVIPIAVNFWVPNDPVVGVFTCILLPMGAAFFRASLAQWQLQRICFGQTPIGRQLLLAWAIICLMISEAILSMLIMAPKNERVPREIWWTLGCAYSLYLASILTALRPMAPVPMDDLHVFADDDAGSP